MTPKNMQLSEVDHPPLTCVMVNKLRTLLETVNLDDRTDPERPQGPIIGDIYLHPVPNTADGAGIYVINQRIAATNGFRQHFYSQDFLEEQSDLIKVDGVWTLRIGDFDG